eukprot:304474-Amphidinium_carterae.1
MEKYRAIKCSTGYAIVVYSATPCVAQVCHVPVDNDAIDSKNMSGLHNAETNAQRENFPNSSYNVVTETGFATNLVNRTSHLGSTVIELAAWPNGLWCRPGHRQ